MAVPCLGATSMVELGDAVAREHAIAAGGSVLVQAPAGSGKTTLLAQRYLRLLATVDAPERVLALTFTRRAAQEMRERVMQALHAAGLPQCPVAMNPRTWALGVAAQRHTAALGLDLLKHPSRLRIETIDAFNAWLAGQLPITAGAGARLNLVEDAKLLYEQAARRALAHENADQFGTAVDRVLALDDQRWHSLVELIARMLPSRDRWLPLLAGHLQATSALDADQLRHVRRQLDEDLGLLVSRTLRLAHEAVGRERLHALAALAHAAALRLDAVDVGGVRGVPDVPLQAWRTQASELGTVASDIARWRGLAQLLLTKDGAYRKQLTKKEGFPPKCADKAVMLGAIEELERDPAVLRALNEIRVLPDPAYDDPQWGRVREVAQVLVLAAAELEQVFRETGAVDFPAVSMAALRALGRADAPTDLSLRLDYKLQHILVDEFQDTSSAQLELIKLLTAGWQRGDERSIFCVGDPMQSIYGFRQAEVRAFLELAEEGVGDVQFEVERLRSNFRSAAPLVEWINACFAQVLPRVDDRERGAIAFRRSEAAMQDHGDAAVSLRGFTNRREEADAVADLIAERSAAHPNWRIVVLVRAKSHAHAIAQSLRRRAIAFRAVDIEPLQQRPVVRDLVMLICALNHLGDRTAWLSILRAPWMGLTLADLWVIARGSEVVWESLGDDGVSSRLTDDGRARCERFRRIVDEALQRRGGTSLTRWVEQTWLALGGPSCAQADEDLEHAHAVFARLRQLEERGLPDAAELAASFDGLFAAHRAPSLVEIMTIHKAKGLEFDLVVVPALDRDIARNRDQLLLSHEFARDGRDGLVLAARPGIGGESDKLFEFLRYQSRDAAGLEAERLLYVACTRAKWQLHLTATIGRDEPEDGASGERRWQPRVGSLLAVLWDVVGQHFALPAGGAPDEIVESAPRGGPLLRVPGDWLPPASALAGAPAGFGSMPLPMAVAATAARVETPVFDWAGETARRVGSLVHAELHALDLNTVDVGTIEGRAGHYGRWLAMHGVPADRVPTAVARVSAALSAVLRDERGRWILKRAERDDLREYALSGRWRGEVVRVVFDRSFVEAGVRWVIDYKTSHHGGGQLEQFLDEEVLRYTPQLHRYAELAAKMGPEPVRVALYFPLMRAWREWAP
jgi:ATP-dependent helicase/nuclease subunit A